MIVDVLHPAHATYVPRRGRTERHGYVAARTPVELAHVPDDEMRLVRRPISAPFAPPVFERGGSLWARVETPPNPGYPGGMRNITPREWVDWLSGRLPESAPAAFQLSCLTAMTPLGVLDRKALSDKLQREPFGRRGEPVDLDAQAIVRQDGRADASAAVARFVAGETLVTDSAVYLRFRPVAVDSGACVELAEMPYAKDLGEFLYSPRTARADIAWRRGMSGDGLPGRHELAADIAAFEAHVEDDIDVRLLANWLPGELVFLARHRARNAADAAGAEAAKAVMREAAALAVAGDVGGVDPADARDHLVRLQAMAVGILEPRPDWRDVEHGLLYDAYGNPYRGREQDWMAAVRQLDRVLARTAPEPVPEDEAAMAGLEGPR